MYNKAEKKIAITIGQRIAIVHSLKVYAEVRGAWIHNEEFMEMIFTLRKMVLFRKKIAQYTMCEIGLIVSALFEAEAYYELHKKHFSKMLGRMARTFELYWNSVPVIE